jgi:3-hydroxyisobutyrate dehydrogenase-like beta-hydroxyacid dehydrogenase
MANLAFLGTGLIGSGMVESARKRGDQVRVWNRTAAKAKALEAHGAVACASAAEAVAGAERVHLSLSDDAAVDAVLPTFVGALAADAIVIDHTTVSPAGTARRFAELGQKGRAFLHAPVFMSPKMARESKGLMLCAGPEATFQRAKAALSSMTGELWYVGPREDRAAAYKLFGNALIVSQTAALADIYAIAARLGVSATDAHSLFSHFNPGAVVQYRGSAMARGDYEAAFELTMARKDVRLMLEAAGDAELTVLPAVAARMDALLARGLGGDDLGVLSIDAVPKRR